jgi:hypothetical protein
VEGIARDVFRVTFDRFSQFDWPTYRTQFLEELPWHLLRTAIGSNGALRDYPRLSGLCADLYQASRRQWNNPELYPPLFWLLQQPEGRPSDAAIRRLELEMGTIELDAVQFGPGFYRLRQPAPAVFRIYEGQAVQLEQLVLCPQPMAARFPMVYLPYPGLFGDVVGPEVPADLPGVLSSEAVEEMIHAAAACLRRYSAELFAGFCEAIGTIGVTGAATVFDRSSYSSRMYYAGGIFSSLLGDNVPALVENLIHEYYHQRLWVWWSIEAPRDLPGEELKVESPVTKTTKSVQVMLHALLIYLGVCDFYRFVLDHEPISDAHAHWVQTRWSELSNGNRRLLQVLIETLQPYPESLQLARFLGEML